MGTIFQDTHRVIVYLGSEQNESRLALTALQFLGNQLEVVKHNLKVCSLEAVEKSWYMNDIDLGYDRKT
jgi:hypothetical protein